MNVESLVPGIARRVYTLNATRLTHYSSTPNRKFANSRQILAPLHPLFKHVGQANVPSSRLKALTVNPRKLAQPSDVGLNLQKPSTMIKRSLEGKVAVVTGAGRGLGFNMAKALAEAGARALVLMDLNEDWGRRAAESLICETGIDCEYHHVDVTDAAAVSQSIDDAHRHFGQIDVLVSSAGIADSNIRAETYDPDMFRRLLDINVTGTFLVAQACAQKMIDAGNHGSLIFIASMSAQIVNYPQEQCCYNASKAAVVHLGRSLAAEWAKHGIRVNSISPGYMDTELNREPMLGIQKNLWTDRTPLKRLGREDELNGLAVFLASDSSSFMTGSNSVIDGGYSLW